MTLIAYWSVTAYMTNAVEHDLIEETGFMLSRAIQLDSAEEFEEEVNRFKFYNPDTRISLEPSTAQASYGDLIPVGAHFNDTVGPVETSIRTVGNEHIVMMRHDTGVSVTLAEDVSATSMLIDDFAAVAFCVAVLGGLLAILAGSLVSSTGILPLARFERAVKHITRTQELIPMPVVGNDELARLTESFNEMIASLRQSRLSQSQLVADAGHELKTPLTSIRTNIELLMQVSRSDADISARDRDDLEADVLAQLAEMSVLIEDLLELARDDSPRAGVDGEVDLRQVIDAVLTRVRRRRSDVTFNVDTQPWSTWGDAAALERAVLNLLDNAVKWSPPDGVVRVRVRQVVGARVRLTVSDSGPGIAAEDRTRIFSRFYRSPESRSMPGSGLGLAITHRVIERHGGTITVEDSCGGGARMVVELPKRGPFSVRR